MLFKTLSFVFLLLVLSAYADPRVEFTPKGSPTLHSGFHTSMGLYFERSGTTLNSSFTDDRVRHNKRAGPLTAWFEKYETGRYFYVRPHNSWLMKNCSKFKGPIEVKILGFRSNGQEAASHELTADIFCSDLRVKGYDFEQYLSVRFSEVKELFDYFWDYSAVGLNFSLGRLEDEDLEFDLIFSAKGFRKTYAELR